MKLKSLRAALRPTVLAASIALAGCSADDSTSGAGPGSSNPAGSSSAEAASQFNDADVMFVQMMIPHHEQPWT
jgi:uncharacterized protein (DUF305 family)